MSLILSPETLSQLQAVAAQRGLPPEDALAQVLAEARAAWEYQQQWEQQEQQDALAGVARSEADFAAGRSLSLEELTASLDATLEAKRQEAAQQKAAS